MAKYEKDRKFYWLQLKEDFFEEGAIDWLEEQDNGIAYSHFYLKLCLKSLRDNGILIRKVGNVLIPYDAKKLAEITKTDLDTVIVAMELLKKIGLVKVFESGEIYLTQIENMIGSKSIGAFKKQQQRQLKKENDEACLPESTSSGQMSEKCPPEIEQEQEQEQEIEIEQEIEQQQDIEKILSENFKNQDIESVKKYCIENNVVVDVVVEKLEIINHMKTVRNKVGALLTAIKEDWKVSKSQNNSVSITKFHNFKARDYDYDSLEKKLLGWENEK